MRKRFAVIFTVVLLLNTFLFAVEAADYKEKDIIAAFSVKPEFTTDMIIVRYADMPGGNDLKFSYNNDTGFLYAIDENRRIFFKELDENVEFTDEALIIKRIEEIDLYLQYSFKAYVYIDGNTAELAGTDASLTDVTVDFMEGRAYFTVRKAGTSSMVNSSNISDIAENNLILVNRSNTLDRSYFPQDLVYSKPSRGRATVDVRLDREAMKQLNFMLDAAYRDGVSGMVITSAYRNFDKQTSLYNNKANVLSRSMSRKSALEEASKVVAIPGSSEHQTGFAADICSEGTGLISNFAGTKQGRWLKDNSWKFGYIVRYPQDKTEITGIIYEPWHVRYVGSGHAEFMAERGMCLEEYIDQLRENKVISFTDSSGSSYAVHYMDKQELAFGGLNINLPESSEWSISNCTRDSYILTIKL